MTNAHLARLPVAPKQGDESLMNDGAPLGPTLLDFWRWSCSDLMANTLRGVLAEYIVAHAIGDRSAVRDPWAPFDLTSRGGVRVEVKAACAIQAWAQKRLSPVSYSIRSARGWSEDTGLSSKAGRHAQVYVFCELVAPEQGPIDPLDTANWRFYVVRTATIEARLPTAKTVTRTSLGRLDHELVPFDELGAAVERAACPG